MISGVLPVSLMPITVSLVEDDRDILEHGDPGGGRHGEAEEEEWSRPGAEQHLERSHEAVGRTLALDGSSPFLEVGR